jgi:Tfp pilus assembly protein PilX
MNRRTQKRIFASERGSALLVALCFTLVLALALASYQTTCYYTMRMGSRGMLSMRSRELAEAGLEEALYALNTTNGVSTANGWTLSNGNATKTLSGFSYESAAVTGQTSITITGYAANKPTIAATGITQGADGTSISRTLTASTGASSTSTTSKAPLFANAIAATGPNQAVSFSTSASNGVLVDSYNSASGTYNALLPDGSHNVGYSAVISGSSVSMPNGTQIKGYVATPPTSSNAVSLTSGTSAKLTGPNTSGSVKIDSSRETTSPYQPVFDVPSASGPTLYYTGGTQNLGTPGATTPTIYTASVNDTSGWSGWYNLAAGTLNINGPVIIVIPGSLYINGSGSIVISSTANSNASLQIVVSGGAYIYYNGINNQTKLAKNLSIIGSGSTYSGNLIQFYASTPYYGTVYAPYDDINVYGYSSTSAVYGSLVGYSVTTYPNGVASLPIHYDTDLANATLSGVTTPYAVSSITDSSL